MYSNIQGYGISGLAKVIKDKCKGPFRELTNVTLNYCSHTTFTWELHVICLIPKIRGSKISQTVYYIQKTSGSTSK